MFIETRGASLFTTAFGPGPRTILAHGGWVGSGELWLPVFEEMSRRWRTVTYDHRGTGATLVQGAITFEDMVADVFAVLDALGIGRCVLAAESAGAAVVLEAALRAPERFEGLVLVAPRHDTRPDAQTDALVAGCRADFAATMAVFVDACLPDGSHAQAQWGRQIVGRSTADAAVGLLSAMVGVTASERAGELKLPVLVLHGARDGIVPVNSSEALAARIRGARLVVHPSAGHVPTVTEPAWVAGEIAARFG